jgi:hypothetical protein
MNVYMELKQDDNFYVANVMVVVSEVLDGNRFELYVPETGHRYEVGEEEPVAMMEAEEVWFQSGGRSRSGLIKVIIDAPKEFPVTRVYRSLPRARGVGNPPPIGGVSRLTSSHAQIEAALVPHEAANSPTQ